MYDRRPSVRINELCKCARMRANGVCVCVYVCRGKYIQKKKKKNERSVHSHLMTNEVERECPWWRALTKMIFGTQRHRETGNPRYFFFIFYVYAHILADILESVRVHSILYLNNDLLFTVQL